MPDTLHHCLPMLTSTRKRIRLVTMTGCLLAGFALPTAAQTISLKTGGDSTAWFVPRLQPDQAQATLHTRKADVALLLTDTTLILQFTDGGIDAIRNGIESDTTKSIGGRVLL